MEGLLSLPRSAKGGLAVLLAVALLGWAIVAYSAKRQHDDARSLENAIATLKSQAGRDDAARADSADLQARLAAAETELEASREAIAVSSEEKRDIEAKLADLETVLADLRGGQSGGEAAEGGALSLLDGQGGDADQDGNTEETVSAEADTLRARLTEAMTSLSAANATVQMRERELDGLRAQRLAAETTIGELEATLAEQAEEGSSADTLNASLASTRQLLADEESRLQELEAARENALAESSSLTAEIEGLEAELVEKEDAIVAAESDLERLEAEIAEAEQRLTSAESELESREALLRAHDQEVQDAKVDLAALKSDQTSAQTQSIELQSTIDRQRLALEDLTALKGDLDETRAELASQTALLDEKRSEIAETDARITEARATQEGGAALDRSLPQIPIAALSTDNPAVLPIDPMQHPFPVQKESGVRLTVIHFDLGSAELSPGGLRRAQEAAAWIKKQGIEKIKLVGATDTIGTEADNLALAERRAQSLLDTFTAEGIDPDRIELISMGEAGGSEIIDDQTAEPLNRCVGVFIEQG